VLVAMLGVWYGVSYLLLDPERRFLVPPPHEVVRVGFLDPCNLEELRRTTRRPCAGWPAR
jgi:NitT/TauT family transport system permease protein